MQHPGAPQRRALLVEDDPFAGQAFADFLNDLGYVTVLVSSYDDAIERFNEHQHAWALLVADIRLRRRSELRGLGPSLGIDLVRYVKLQAPQTPVLIWTAYTTLLSSIMPLLADGITGLVCLPKGSAAEQVQHAIHQAEAGAISIHYAPDDVSPQVAEQILQALPPATAVLVRRLAPQIAGLSRRCVRAIRR
jgi:CheY-like chemotaxis protein